MPAFGGCDDGLGSGPPAERLRALIVVLDEAVDGGLKGDQGVEHAALETSLGELGEEAFDGVQPRARGRGEVEGPAWVAVQPVMDLAVLVRRIVVENYVDHLTGRDLPLDPVEEGQKLLVPVALAALADHGAVERVE